MSTEQPQTISYPAPEGRPHRYEDVAVDPHVIVLFGATGDLAKRKLLPGMAYLEQSELAPDIQVIGTSLEELTDDEFRAIAKQAIDSFGTHKLTEEQWNRFAKTLRYVPQSAGPEALAAAVAERGGQPRRRVVDLVIAATANVHDVPLLTADTADLSIIDDLVKAFTGAPRERIHADVVKLIAGLAEKKLLELS